MNIVLWITAGLLAFAFFAAGGRKLAQSREAVIASGQGWAEDFSPGAIKAIGALEVLAAVALIVPPLLDTAADLAVAAAIGLAALMVGAAVVHGRRHETKFIVVNLVLAALAIFLAAMRLGPEPF